MTAKPNTSAKIFFPLISSCLILLASMTIAILFTETIWQQEWSRELPAHYWYLLPVTGAIFMFVFWIFSRKLLYWSCYGFTLTVIATSIYDRMHYRTAYMQILWFIGIASFLGIFAYFIPTFVQKRGPIRFGERITRLRENTILIKLWTNYSIQSRYSQKVLGIGWVMLYPLMEASVIGFAFSVLLGRGEIAGKPFSIFILSGIVVFDLFSRIVNQSTISLITSMGVIKQIYFPREIILLVLMGVELVNFSFAFLALVVVNAFFGSFPNFDYFLLILPAAITAVIALGVSLYASVCNMIFRDLQQLILIAIRLLFYVTVLFSLQMVTPETMIYGQINPLTTLVEFFRSVVLYESPPELITLVWPAVFAVVLLYSGYIFFAHHEGRFIDYI